MTQVILLGHQSNSIYFWLCLCGIYRRFNILLFTDSCTVHEASKIAQTVTNLTTTQGDGSTGFTSYVVEEMGKEVAKEIGMQIISNLVQGGEWAFHMTLISGANHHLTLSLSLQQLAVWYQFHQEKPETQISNYINPIHSPERFAGMVDNFSWLSNHYHIFLPLTYYHSSICSLGHAEDAENVEIMIL